MKSHDLGKLGEEYAQKYLIRHGYRILGINIHSRQGEIDCLCMHESTLICVEVKSRSRSTMGQPYEAVSHLKRYKIMQTLYEYLRTHRISYSHVQIDVISLIINPNGTIHDLKHFKNDLL